MKYLFIFCFICISLSIYNFILNDLIITEAMHFNTYSKQLDYERIEQLIKSKNKFAWIGYIFIPIRILFKLGIITSCLWLAIFFTEIRTSTIKLFSVVIMAELVNLVPPLIKIIWFGFFQTDYTLIDLQWFFSLSALSLFERENVEKYLAYPLQLLSIWELAYWLLLGYGLSRVLQKPLSEGMRLVAVSYGPALALWVLFVVFLSVNLG